MSRTDGLYGVIERRAVAEIVKLAASGDKKKILRAFRLAEKVTPDIHQDTMRFIREKVEQDHPALELSRRIGTELNPNCRDRFIESFVMNSVLRGVAKRRELTTRTGAVAPTTILMSPTMRCNLACEGCYAAEYAPDRDLDESLMQRIVDEGNDMGVYLFTMLGGEPFVYEGLIDFAQANRDAYFQVFTNGTLLDDDMVARVAEAGNIFPVVSIEGSRELTDWRRGRGVYDEVMDAVTRLGRAGVPFGYSVTVMRSNWKNLLADEFVDPLVERGALLAWHFLYMPIGRDPDMSLMLTPEMREEFREGIHRLRSTKPYFPMDFWGDAPYVNGCIAGRHYLHITSEGWVEPCIFTHFATDNIRDVSVMDAFNSPYFNEIRRRQPFNQNLLMPCMWIDNPHCSREIMAATGARPTHEGADVMLTDLRKDLDVYAARSARVFAPVWACMHGHEGPQDERETAAPEDERREGGAPRPADGDEPAHRAARTGP